MEPFFVLQILFLLALMGLWNLRVIRAHRQQQALMEQRLRRLEAGEAPLHLLEALEIRVQQLEAGLGSQAPGPSPPQPSAPEPAPAAWDRPAEDKPAEHQPAGERPASSGSTLSRPDSIPATPRPAQPAAALTTARLQAIGSRLQRQLVENWTGILGVVVLVAGITFLTVNLALRLGPQARFTILLLLAAGLVLPSLVSRPQSRWRPLSLWLRSGGGALVLLACVAGGALPELGMRWLHTPPQALALVLAGITVNLALAALSGSQAIASLHVLINLVPLLVVPQGAVPLSIATLVCAWGQWLPWQRPWDRHRLLVILGYGLFQLSWAPRCLPQLLAQPALRGAAVAAVVLVCGSGVLLPQLGKGLQRRLTASGLAVPIAGWGAIALALLLYPREAAVRVGALLAAAVLAGGLALRARRGVLPARGSDPGGGRWLQHSHTLIAQSLVLVALISLGPLLADRLLLTTVVLVEVVLFLALGVREGEPLIRRIGWVLTAGVAMVLVLLGGAAVLAGPLATPLQQLRPWGLLLGSAGLVGLVLGLWQQRSLPVPKPGLLEALTATLAFEASLQLAPHPWRPLLSLASLAVFLFVARRFALPDLARSTSLAVAATHLVAWLWLLVDSHSTAVVLLQLACLLALALFGARMLPGGKPRGLALFLMAITVGLGAKLLLEPVSPLLPGLAWLVFSLVTLVLADRLGQAEAVLGLRLALGYLGGFVLLDRRLLFPRLLEGAWLNAPLPLRWLAALLPVLVFLGWWLYRPRRLLASSPLWQSLHPWFVEAVLGALALALLREWEGRFLPIGWSLVALGLLSPPARRLLAPRVRLYAVFFYGVAILATLQGLANAEVPGRFWLVQSSTLSLTAILLQVLFVALSLRWLPSSDLREPGGWPPLAAIGRLLARHPQRWLCYPLFLAVALHLAHRYDNATLTLLWALQAFVIAVLSVLLRDGQIRTVALLALGAALVRLLAIDLAQADLGLRGLVFVGVGLLMLAMNTLYTHFRERFR
jgi:hypothetical protein